MANHRSGKEEKFDFFQPRWLWISGGVLSGCIFLGIVFYLFTPEAPKITENHIILLSFIYVAVPLVLPLVCSLIRRSQYNGSFDQRSRNILIIVISGIFVVAGIAFFASGVEDFGVVVLFIGLVPLFFLHLDRKEEEIKKAKNNIEIVSEGRIRVKACGEINKKVLFMSRHQEAMMKFNPATLTYTGVTVGGVTTGGLDYQQEHYSIEGGTVTDRFNLWYKEGDNNSMIVMEVELASGLVSKAKKDPSVSKYLKGNTLYLQKETNGTWGKLATDHMKSTGDYMGALNLYAKENTAKLLTKIELAPIYSFICTAQTTGSSQRQAKTDQTTQKKTNNDNRAKTGAKSAAQTHPKQTNAPAGPKKAMMKELKDKNRAEKLAILSHALSNGIISYEEYEELVDIIS